MAIHFCAWHNFRRRFVRQIGRGVVWIVLYVSHELISHSAPKSRGDSKAASPVQFAVTDDGAVVRQGDGWLKIQAISEDIIRVAYSRDRNFFAHPSLAVLPQALHPAQVRSDSSQLTRLDQPASKPVLIWRRATSPFSMPARKFSCQKNGATSFPLRLR